MKITLDDKTIGSGSVNFTQSSILGDKHLTFSIMQYESYKSNDNQNDPSEGVYGFKSTGESIPFNHNVA